MATRMGDRCFCVFEGGGAKGIAHVGALSALENSDLELSGFAGTSAGAVIAALAAVGYRSSDLVSECGSVLDLVDLDSSNIWAGDPWKPARTPRRLFGRRGWTGIVLARTGGGYALAVVGIAAFLCPAALTSLGLVSTSWSIWVAVGCMVGLLLLATVVSSGLASLKTFEAGLNQLLRLRIAGKLDPLTAHRARLPVSVTFRDLHEVGCPPLRVVASDISGRELKLFSHAATPDMGVASAVAASVCLPVIFKPWRIGGRLHLDGGLVSNLPAWAFDAERALDRDAWTAVIQVGAQVEAKSMWGIGILKGAVLTGIFGSGILNMRNVDRLKGVRLKVSLKLLQFDPGLAVACATVEQARATTLEKLVYHIRDVPQLMNAVCEQIRVRAHHTLTLALRTQGGADFEGRIRVSIFVRARDDQASLSAEFQTGFLDDPDERVRLPINGSIVGQALRDRDTFYLERSDPTWSSYLARPQDRWLRKHVSPSILWVLCVPYVKEEEGIELVVAIDSDTAVALDPDLVDVAMDSISDAVVIMLEAYVPKEAFGDGSP